MEKGNCVIVEEDQLSVQAGVPRREQCLVCDKPIFLAERFRVGDHFYHRRCLRCARCNTQLTLGNFYETETDGQFCCETCPDEEEKRGGEEDSDSEAEEDSRVVVEERMAAAAEEEKRISSLMSNRLAMFETKPISRDQQEVRNLSVTDEQKSQSMKKFLANDDDVEGEEPPPLPNNAPPEISVKTPPETDHVDEESVQVMMRPQKNENVRESQSVSNIREMFEKKTNNQGNKLDVETRDRPESISNFYSPLPAVQRVNRRLNVDSGESATMLEFKTPRKPSEEHWEDVKEVVEKVEMDKTTDSKELDDDVFMSPRMENEEKLVTGDNLESVELVDDKVPEISGEEKEEEKIVIKEEKDEELARTIEEEENSFATKESDLGEEQGSLDKTSGLELSGQSVKEEDGLQEKEELETKVVVVTEEMDVDEDKKGNELVLCTSEHEVVVVVEVNQESHPEKEEDKEEVKVPLSNISSPVKESPDESQYPLELNPFGSDEEDEPTNQEKSVVASEKSYNASLNPFGDDDEEDEEPIKPQTVQTKRISTNPFGSDDEDDQGLSVSYRTPEKRITPVPTPRKTFSAQRPEPSPRTSQLRVPYGRDNYGSVSSLSKSSDFRGSTNSLSSTCSSANTSGTYQRTLKKRRAPLPPSMRQAISSELLLSPPVRKTSDASMKSDQSVEEKSTSNSPRSTRKKRPAPKPPTAVNTERVSEPPVEKIERETIKTTITEADIKSPPFDDGKQEMIHSTPLKLNQSAENTQSFSQSAIQSTTSTNNITIATAAVPTATSSAGQRVIPVDYELLDDDHLEETSAFSLAEEPTPLQRNNSILLRRVIKPLTDDDATPVKSVEEGGEEKKELSPTSRQWEKLKENKESENRNRQSLVSNSSDNGGVESNDRFYNKSAQGKWKRRKGPAPSLPVPPKRVLEMLPIQDIRHELEVIEVQQQGLEKQGVQLEKMIRERTEGVEGSEGGGVTVAEDNNVMDNSMTKKNTAEVEGLIMQLFDLVVEKNELFRRQAELMYLRRQHRLEVEQADLEYEIRVLMAQPECNKTDSDKAKEETMIARLMEVVRQRNAVVDSLEMDRLREAQEDLGIKQEMEIYTAKRDEEFSLQKEKPVKLSKKEKKTLKEEKKKLKQKKLDVDKDYDETETSPSDKSFAGTLDKSSGKKKKKKFLIL